MVGRLPVFVYAADAADEKLVVSQLQGLAELVLVAAGHFDSARVALVVTDDVDGETIQAVRALQRNGCPRVLVLAGRVDDAGLLAAVEAGACGVLRRAESGVAQLVAAIMAAADGEGTLSPDLVGKVLDQVSLLQREVLSPLGIRFSGLSEREAEILKLLADGHDTAEIADRLHYSERTVKKVVQDITRRHNLRNRTHAVAFALRQGLI